MTTLTRFSPFTAATLFSDFDQLFQGAARAAEGPVTFTPATDIHETKDALELSLDLPGFAPEAIDVKVEGDVLTITAERKAERAVNDDGYVRRERRYGTYSRSFVLPETVDGNAPAAKYAHGVLTVTFPKKEEAKPRSVQVKVVG